eukprot:146334-Chlamydomonas_euryale.AAC.4
MCGCTVRRRHGVLQAAELARYPSTSPSTFEWQPHSWPRRHCPVHGGWTLDLACRARCMAALRLVSRVCTLTWTRRPMVASSSSAGWSARTPTLCHAAGSRAARSCGTATESWCAGAGGMDEERWRGGGGEGRGRGSGMREEGGRMHEEAIKPEQNEQCATSCQELLGEFEH